MKWQDFSDHIKKSSKTFSYQTAYNIKSESTIALEEKNGYMMKTGHCRIPSENLKRYKKANKFVHGNLLLLPIRGQYAYDIASFFFCFLLIKYFKSNISSNKENMNKRKTEKGGTNNHKHWIIQIVIEDER